MFLYSFPRKARSYLPSIETYFCMNNYRLIDFEHLNNLNNLNILTLRNKFKLYIYIYIYIYPLKVIIYILTLIKINLIT